MKFFAFLSNPVLWGALIAWGIAQILKTPIHYLRTRKVDWTFLLRAGGMPSSHSAFVAATAHGVGLFYGFETPLFAVALALAVIVIYDATGVRRQAGKHAERINAIIDDLRRGKPYWHETQERLKEVLGHTPFEAIAGTLLGVGVIQLAWMVAN